MSTTSISLACEESAHDDCHVVSNCGCSCHRWVLDLRHVRTRTKAESDYWVNQLELEVRRLRAVVVDLAASLNNIIYRLDQGVAIGEARDLAPARALITRINQEDSND